MSQKTRASLTAGAQSAYPDNIIGAITPLADRTQHIDEIDSGLLLAELNAQIVQGLVNYTGGLQVNGVNITGSGITFIRSESDFPVQDATTITLESKKIYVLAADVSTAKYFVCEDAPVLTAFNILGPVLTYTGTGSMFTGTDVTFSISDIQKNHPNAQGYDFTDTIGGQKLFISSKVRTISGTKYGTFDNMQTLLIEGSSVLDMDDGISISGSSWIVFSIDKFFIGSTSATFKGVDLGTAISQTIELNNFIANAPAGGVGISGLANSGNVPVGRLAMVTNSEFGGGMTQYLENITNEDIRWDFKGNTPVPDTIVDAMVSLNNNVTETVITAVNTPVKVVGTFVCERDSLFSCATDGTITLTSERDVVLPIDITDTELSASGTNKDIHVYLALNGSVIANSGKQNRVGATDPRNTGVLWQMKLVTGDFLNIFKENNTDTINLITTDAILRAR